MSFRIACVGCDKQSYMAAADAMVNRHAIKALFMQGDTPYIGTNSHSWQASAPTDLTGVSQPSVAQIQEHYTEAFANPGWQHLLGTSIPIYGQWDDHEMLGDNWDHGSAAAGASPALTPNTNQTDRNTHFARCRQAWVELHTTGPGRLFDTPAHGDSEAGEVPPQVAGGTHNASDYTPLYYRVGFQADGTIIENPSAGQLSSLIAQAYVTDTMTHRNLTSMADGPTKYLMGAVQRQWMKDEMDAFQAANSAGFHLWVCAKNFYSDTQDGYSDYPDEKTWIQSNILDGSITGLVQISNDTHRHFIAYNDTYPMLCVCPGPIDQTMTGKASIGAIADTQWVSKYEDGDTHANAYGLLNIAEGRMGAEIRLSGCDELLWSSPTVSPGSNVVDFG